MNKNLNKRGASKKKGAAYVSEELTEDGPAIDVADKGIARKKGAAQQDKNTLYGSDDDIYVKPDFTPESKSGWDAVSLFGQTQYDKHKTDLEKSEADVKLSGMYDSIVKSGKGAEGKADALATYGADYGKPRSISGGGVKQPHGFTTKKGVIEQTPEQLKAYKDWTVDQGAKRMGFTQNFGAARQNSYAKGAAKVNSIMNYGGAAKAKGAAEYGGKKGDESKSHLDYEE